MTFPPREEFGRRARLTLSIPAPAQRQRAYTGSTKWDALMGAQPSGSGEAYRIVPIRLLPILCAAAGLLALQLVDWAIENPGRDGVVGWLSAASGAAPSASQVAEFGPRIGFILVAFVPVLLALLWSVGHFAAVYTIAAQAPLRWLRWTSPLAFALGGAATAYVFLAVTCLLGGRATVAGLVVTVLGGAICGYIYRKSAGTVWIEPEGDARTFNTSEEFEVD
jgi:hypothetical protein